MRSLIRSIDICSRWLSTQLALVGGIYCGFLMITIVVDATGRYLFNHPLQVIGSIISVTAPLLFSVGLAYAQSTNSHIKLTIFTNRLRKKPGHILNIMVLLINILLLALLTFLTAGYAMESWQIREYEPGLMKIPIYPTKILLCFCIFLFFVRYVVDLLNFLGLGSTDE